MTKRKIPDSLTLLAVVRICFLTAGLVCFWPAPGDADEPETLNFDLSHPSAVLPLAPALKEISGLALDASGALIGHNDERAISYTLSPDDGTILGRFVFEHGKRPLNGDFEGIARAQGLTWLVNSRGFVFASRPGLDRVQVYNTGLARVCEVEGLAAWPQKNALVIACKKMLGKTVGKKSAIFLWSLERHTLTPEPLTLSRKKLKSRFEIKGFRPSALAISADGKRLTVLSSKPPALAVLDADGTLLEARKLKRSFHPQPEGLAFLPDGTLVIADERQKGPGTLTLYHRLKTR